MTRRLASLTLSSAALVAVLLGSFAAPADAVTGGRIADFDAYSWVAQVHVNDENECGGSLIAPAVVATAARCIQRPSGRALPLRRIGVVLGRGTLKGTDGERFGVTAVVRHEQFDSSAGAADVALLQLSRPSRLRPVFVASRGTAAKWGDRKTARVLGWGGTRAAKKTSNSMRIGSVRLGSQASCARAWRRSYGQRRGRFVASQMLCAGLTARAGTDTCTTDRGGPLIVFREDGLPVLAGVTLTGAEPCGPGPRPSSYARVGTGALADWIAHNTVALTQDAQTKPAFAPPTPPAPNTPEASQPSRGLLGRWIGPIRQTPAARVDYRADLSVEQLDRPNERAGSILYPEIFCGGVLTFLNGGDRAVRIREDLTFGTDTCVDTGVVRLTLQPGNERAEYHWSNEATSSVADGVLARP